MTPWMVMSRADHMKTYVAGGLGAGVVNDDADNSLDGPTRKLNTRKFFGVGKNQACQERGMEMA